MTMATGDVDLAEVDLTDLDRWWADGPPSRTCNASLSTPAKRSLTSAIHTPPVR
jgi:hypothetical protein